MQYLFSCCLILSWTNYKCEENIWLLGHIKLQTQTLNLIHLLTSSTLAGCWYIRFPQFFLIVPLHVKRGERRFSLHYRNFSPTLHIVVLYLKRHVNTCSNVYFLCHAFHVWACALWSLLSVLKFIFQNALSTVWFYN